MRVPMTHSPSARTRAFVSYSHADEEHLQRLHTHLEYYKREQKLDVWDDTRITPGAHWKEEIKAAITSAKVAILLISADFLASDFITHDEIPPLLEAAEQEGTRILLVILSPCAFQRSKLARYQTLNKPSEPLIGASKVRQEEIWAKLAEQVADTLAQANIMPSTGHSKEETNGKVLYGRIIDCWTCGGKGYLKITYQYAPDRREDCYRCNGTGKLRVPSELSPV